MSELLSEREVRILIAAARSCDEDDEIERRNAAKPKPARLTLPWKVLVPDNARHGLLRGRILLTERYRMALAAASLLAAQQWQRPAIKTSVALTITLHEPDKRRRDIGNYVKLLADTLTRVAFVDDSQIDRLTVIRGHLDRFNPRAELEIGSL